MSLDAALGFATGGIYNLVETAGKKPKVPTEKDTAEAKRKREEELRMRKGRGASILTGGAGITNQPTLGKSSLLGAS